MKTIRQKIIYHTHGWRTALSVLFVIAFLPLWYKNVTQYLAPTADYYKYNIENPVEVISAKVWENLLLESKSTYLKSIKMVWFDTLICDGIKYNTQVWEDYKTPGTYVTKWEYSQKEFTWNEKICTLCGSMIWVTSRGYEKRFNYCTEDFTIKK